MKVQVIDGGLSSQLIENGYGSKVFSDPLWTARLLHDDPSAIKKAHTSFLKSGSNVIITSSYQASIGGFKRHLKLNTEEAETLLASSVDIAKDSLKDLNCDDKDHFIAASIGPYGACLHDGSEYTGSYIEETSMLELKAWHRGRMEIIARKNPDFFAFETIPATAEANVLLELLREFPNIKAWLTLTCKNGKQTCHGESFKSAVSECLHSQQLVGVGANCCSPTYIKPLLHLVKDRLTPDVAFVAYPNSGKEYITGKGWESGSKCGSIASLLPQWLSTGHLGWVGGCCTTTAKDIGELRPIVDLWNASP